MELLSPGQISLFVQAFILLFTILNALGNVPIFLTLTGNLSRRKRGKIISDSVLLSFIILVAFAFAGWEVFKFFGITLSDFKIAGGVLLFYIAFDQLRGEVSRIQTAEADQLAAFPLATPLLAGPGSISTVMILSNPPYGPVITFLTIAINSTLAWIVLVKGELLTRMLGKNGMRVFTRIMGLFIAAIGITFIREGALELVESSLRTK